MPDKPKSHLGSSLAGLGVIVSVIFLLNLTLGIVEIPDNLPVVGNIDEAFFTGLLIACLRYLGFDPIPFKGRSRDKQEATEQG